MAIWMKFKQLDSDFPYGGRSKRNAASEPLHMCGVAYPPPAQRLGHGKAGKIGYVYSAHLGNIAAPQQIVVGKERDRSMDTLASMGGPGK